MSGAKISAMSMSGSAWLLFVALSIVWGVPYFMIKVALVELTPSWIAFARVVVGAAAFIIFVPRADWRALNGHFGAIAAIAFADIALPFYLIANGERTVSSSLTGIVLSSMPIAVSILAFATDRRKRLTPTQVLGLAIGIVGVAAILGFGGGTGRADGRGVLMIVGATLSYSVGVLMIEHWLPKLPTLAATAAIFVVAAVMLAPPALVAMPTRVPSVSAFAAIAVLGAVCTAAAYPMYFALIARAGPARASVVTYLNPAVAALLGVVLLHESMGPSAVAGLLLVIAGSWLSTRGAGAQTGINDRRLDSD